MMDIPLGDLIYDLIHAVALDDEVEVLEAAMTLSKAAQKKIEDRTLDGSPSVALKLRRLHKRLKQSLGTKGFEPEPAAKATPSADAGLGELDWTPDDDED